MTAPTLRLVDAKTHERLIPLRLPFRFGAATLTEARQVFLRVTLEDVNGRRVTGVAAELMVPKWFDKNPELSNDDNADQLRLSLALAVDAARAHPGGTAFALHAAIEDTHHQSCAAANLNGLVASFGLALVDRAVLDGLCQLTMLPATQLLQRNLAGITAATAPDLGGFALDDFLRNLQPANRIAARHTVGMADYLTRADADAAKVEPDGLPKSLEAAISAYGLTHFKLKLAARETEDVERLTAIAAVLDRHVGSYRVTLDGNEQFTDAAQVVTFLRRITAEPKLARLLASTLFIEQPIARAQALDLPVAAISAVLPIEIDESDSEIGIFPRAVALGYTGISSKSCKGLYRALLNRARIARLNAGGATSYFMSGEDLTTQSGIAVQQDLLLASLVGATHVERNGHHYVDGMQGAAAAEQRAYLDAHGDLYTPADGRARLTIRNGEIALGSVLQSVGLGVAATARDATFAALATAS